MKTAHKYPDKTIQSVKIPKRCSYLSAASATGSSGETASAGDKTLRLARGSDIQTMDVHKTSSNYCVPMNVFERLFESKLNDEGRTEQPLLRPCGDHMAACHRAGELEL
ncbi:hypothetical protein MR578_08175 [bacterium]|nr:hypothetical protein [bacterium]